MTAWISALVKRGIGGSSYYMESVRLVGWVLRLLWGGAGEGKVGIRILGVRRMLGLFQ
jgi:hypothetical protein